MKEINLTEKDFFNEVLKSEQPVLVDFGATWCGPCQMMIPIVDELADELDGKVKVAKVNVDENGALAGKYNVMSIPTFIIFYQGQVVEQLMGPQTKEFLKQRLESIK